MQFVSRAGAGTHLGDLLPTFHLVAFLDEALAVVTIGRKEIRVVLDDDQFAVTKQPVAAVHDLSIGRSNDRVARLAGNIDTLPRLVAGDKCTDQAALARPAPGHAICTRNHAVVGNTRRWSR